jgi:hypothetical protein
MERWRKLALVVALIGVAVAAALRPLLGSAPADLAGGAEAATGLASTQPPATELGTGLGLAAANVRATAIPDGSVVVSVRLTAHLRSSDVLMLRTDASGPALRFTLVAPQSVAVVGTLHATAPATIPAGIMQSFDLTFDLRGLSALPPSAGEIAAGGPPARGAWLLAVDLVDIAGIRHHAETAVFIAPTA